MSSPPTAPRRRTADSAANAPLHPAVLVLRVALTVSILTVAVLVVPFAKSIRVGDQALYLAFSNSLSRKPEEALQQFEISWKADASNHDTAQMYAGELARAATVQLSRGGDTDSAEVQLRQSLALMDAGHRYPMHSQSHRLRAEILNNLAKIERNRHNGEASRVLTGEALDAVHTARYFVNEPPRNAVAFHSVAFEIALRQEDVAESIWTWRELMRHRSFANGMPARPAQEFVIACARSGNGAIALVEARRQLLLNPGSRPWAGALSLSRSLPYGERSVALVLEELRSRELLLPAVEAELSR